MQSISARNNYNAFLQKQDMNTSTITRAALGKSAFLGELYDARTDNFCKVSIFRKNVPDDAVSIMDIGTSDINLTCSDTFTDKFRALNVSADLQVSFLGGLFSLSGSGNYLNDKKASRRSVRQSLVYNIQTKNEQLNIYHEDLKDCFALEAIKEDMGTHIVAGIIWGANSVIECEFSNNEGKDITEVSGELRAKMDMSFLQVDGSASVKFKEGEIDNDQKFSLRIFGDVLPKDKPLPTDFRGALKLMTEIPMMVKDTNNGNGKPLFYHLVPLSLLHKYIGFELVADSLVKSLEEASLIRVVHIYEEISSCGQQIQDFYDDAYQFRQCVYPDDLKAIVDLKAEFSIEEARFRSKLGILLTAARQGKAGMSDIEDLVAEFNAGKFSSVSIKEQFKKWEYITKKVAFARRLIHEGATYLECGRSFEEVIMTSFKNTLISVFFFRQDVVGNNDSWTQNLNLVFEEIKERKSNCFLIDCDLHTQLWPAGGLSIQTIVNGKVVCANLLEERKREKSTAYAEWSPAGDSTTTPKVRVRVHSKPDVIKKIPLPCAGIKCDKKAFYTWHCKDCKELFQVDMEFNFYCDCGKDLVHNFKFRCPHPDHGIQFDSHQKEYIISVIKDHFKEEAFNSYVKKCAQLASSNLDEAKTWFDKYRAFCGSSISNDVIDKLIKLVDNNFEIGSNLCLKLFPEGSEHLAVAFRALFSSSTIRNQMYWQSNVVQLFKLGFLIQKLSRGTNRTVGLFRFLGNSGQQHGNPCTAEKTETAKVYRSAFELLPSCVRSIVSGGCVYLWNTKFGEYLYTAANHLAHDSKRRNLFTWNGGAFPEASLVFEPVRDNKFYIRFTQMNEYMYAAQIKHSDQRRRVFTWRPGGLDNDYDVMTWTVQVTADNSIQIINYKSEPLYAAAFKRDSDRRYVFNWIPKSVDDQCDWVVK